MPIILDGKIAANDIISSLKNKKDSKPSICFFRIGDDPASITYEKAKIKDCEKYGINYNEYIFKESDNYIAVATTMKLAAKDFDAILLFTPLPKGWENLKTVIPLYRDVDGANYARDNGYEPCTPAGALALLEYYDIPVEGKHCVVLGRSDTVGKPLAQMLLNRNATVTICHSKTQNLAEITKTADILFSAIGKPKFITEDMVKEGAVVVDIGINRDENGKLCGDVDYERVASKTSAITPVPGGCGPMTRAMLMRNIYEAHNRS